MSFSLRPDYEEVKKRYEAFWERSYIGRPLVTITLPPKSPVVFPEKNYPNEESRWLDIEYRAEMLDLEVSSRRYLADSLPIAFPNLGPEIYSVWCGCDLKYSETTTWSEPCVFNWEKEGDKARFNENHPLFKVMVDFTKALLERGKGKFIVGLTDFHPGGDHLAALRDPANLAMDMIENPQWVKKALADSTPEYFKCYDIFYHMLREADMPITSWLNLIYEGRYYIPSNDFSCMISPAMFQEFFLPGIKKECQFLDKSIYHLDGPGALQHLDVLLEIDDLDAVQWVPGAGNEGFEKWIPVYQKIQKANKGMQILNLGVGDLDLLFDNLKPDGLYITGIDGVDDEESCNHVLKRLEKWS
jgi:hypothetical protein